MNTKLDELLAAFTHAVEINDDEKADILLWELGWAAEDANGSLDIVLEPVLSALLVSRSAENNCGFFVFTWLEGKFREFSDPGRARIQAFVAAHYGEYHDIVADEMADFVGGFRDDWAICVVSDWISAYESFTEGAIHGIDTALKELEDDPPNARADPNFVARVQALARRFAEKQRAAVRSS